MSLQSGQEKIPWEMWGQRHRKGEQFVQGCKVSQGDQSPA